MFGHELRVPARLLVQFLDEYEQGVVATDDVVQVLLGLDVGVEATDQEQEQLTQFVHRATLYMQEKQREKRKLLLLQFVHGATLYAQKQREKERNYCFCSSF